MRQSFAHRRFYALILIGAALLLATPLYSEDPVGAGSAYVLTVDGALGPASRDYIVRGIEQAERDRAELVVLRLNTPGGLDASTRDIVEKLLNAKVPVATWVAPAGARAASAGTYMLFASHIAAMAPATNLGAATPVQIGGGGGAPSQPTTPIERVREAAEEIVEGTPENPGEAQNAPTAEAAEQPPATQAEPAMPTDAASRKAINDAVAYIKGLAERHGRNAEWAERAVREAVSLTAAEALEQNVIDVIASNLPELLAAIDGREVRMENGMLTLATGQLAIVEIETDWRTDLLAIITNPTMAYILLMIGIYGLILEGYNPGTFVPGVIGGICLLLALYAFQILPVNYAGLALMLLGFALIAVELFVPSFGVLGIGGVIAVVFGSVILMDSDIPGFGIPIGMIAGMAIVSALLFFIIIYLAARAVRRPQVAGREALVGHEAEAIRDFSEGRGRVHLQGEDWSARATVPIGKGQKVRVTALQSEGLVLDVEPIAHAAPETTDGSVDATGESQ